MAWLLNLEIAEYRPFRFTDKLSFVGDVCVSNVDVCKVTVLDYVLQNPLAKHSDFLGVVIPNSIWKAPEVLRKVSFSEGRVC